MNRNFLCGPVVKIVPLVQKEVQSLGRELDPPHASTKTQCGHKYLKRKKKTIQKLAKDLNSHLTEEDTWMAKKCLERCSTLFSLRNST